MRSVTVIITGNAATGKSTIARLLKDALESYGIINIDYLAELDDYPKRDPDHNDYRLEFLRSQNVHIQIRETDQVTKAFVNYDKLIVEQNNYLNDKLTKE